MLEKSWVQEEVPSCSSSLALSESNSHSENENDEGDVELYVQPKKNNLKAPLRQMRIKLTETALTSQRFGVSDRATALIVTSAFKDAGISSDQSVLVTDRNKIRRDKFRVGNDLNIESKNTDPILGFYFVGRKNYTLAQVKKSAKYYRRSIKEEHISLTAEPNSKYVGHVTPKSGSAEDECNAIYEFASKELNGDLSELLLVGADGTNVNTDWKGGVIQKLEEKFGQPLQWIVCLLHFTELPFRSLFQHIDGITSAPRSYTGPIGSKLNGFERIYLLLLIKQSNVTYLRLILKFSVRIKDTC